MNGMILFIGALFLLWVGRSILIPLLVATFFWYLINAISTYYRKVLPYNANEARSKYFWKAKSMDFISQLLSFLTLCGVIYFFITQVRPMFTELFLYLPELQHKIINFSNYLYNSIGLKFDASMIPNLTNIAANVGASVANIATSTGMILIYMLFMFIPPKAMTFRSIIPLLLACCSWLPEKAEL